MDTKQTTDLVALVLLGQEIKARREALGLSLYAVTKRITAQRGVIVREAKIRGVEEGRISISTTTLAYILEALEVESITFNT